MSKAKEEEKVLQSNEAPAEDNLNESSCDSARDDEKVETAKVKSATPTMAELIAAEKKRMEEYVTIELLKDDGKYKDDVYVAVNGQNCVIQRGVPVRIKRKFALELAKSQFEDQRTAARIALLTEK